MKEINFLVIIIIIIIIIIITINTDLGSIYKYSRSCPYLNERIKIVKITYKICMINIRVP